MSVPSSNVEHAAAPLHTSGEAPQTAHLPTADGLEPPTTTVLADSAPAQPEDLASPFEDTNHASGSPSAQSPRWAYGRGDNAVPLRQGPYLDSGDAVRSTGHRQSLVADSEGSHAFESAHEDPFNDAQTSAPPHTALFMSPAAGSQTSVDDTTGALPRSESQMPAYTRQRDSVATSTGGTAAAREAAVAAGYSSPRTRAAPVLSPSQHFNTYDTPPLEAEREMPPPHESGVSEKAAYDPEATKGTSGGLLSGWRKWALIAALAIVALAIGLGVGLGVGLNKGSHHTSHLHKGKTETAQTNVAAPDTTTPPDLKPLPPWNWTDTKNKVYGVNIGGQFLLERWLFEDWMTQVGGPEAWDEWSLSEKLGEDKMRDTLNEHMSTWFVESHMDEFKKAGINMIRIPIGYWPFLSTAETQEPYVNASHLDYLTLALNWAWKRSMYVVLDLHGLPGSQNGDQSSGHNMSLHSGGNNDVPWYQDKYQNLSKTAVTNMLDWIDKHPARSIVCGVTTVNEPQTDGGNKTRASILKDFYRWSIETTKKYKMPVVLHHGFIPHPYKYWEDFMSDQDPNMVIFDDHPYPAWFQNPNPTDEDKIKKNICDLGDEGKDFPVPVVMGEWSGVNNVNKSDVTTEYLNTQVNTYGWSAGSMFFNFRVNTTENPVLGPPVIIARTYSLLDLLPPDNPVGQFPIYNGSVPVHDFTSSLKPSCGSTPTYPWMEKEK